MNQLQPAESKIAHTLRDIARRLEASTDTDPRFHAPLPDDADLPDEIREQADQVDMLHAPSVKSADSAPGDTAPRGAELSTQELRRAIQHRIDQCPSSLQYIMVPKDWAQQAVRELAPASPVQAEPPGALKARAEHPVDVAIRRLRAQAPSDSEDVYLRNDVLTDDVHLVLAHVQTLKAEHAALREALVRCRPYVANHPAYKDGSATAEVLRYIDAALARTEARG